MSLGKVVIGRTLESLMYAFYDGCHYLSTSAIGPQFYEKHLLSSSLSISSKKIWDKLKVLHSLSGKVIPSVNYRALRIRDNELTVSSDLGVQKYVFEKCIIFDSAPIDHENEIVESRAETFSVIDDFELKRLGREYRTIDPLHREGSLARDLYFYTSERIPGAKYVTDCAVASFLTAEMLYSVDFSDTAVKFIVEREIANTLDIKGKNMGFYKNGSIKYYKPEATHKHRFVQKIDNNVYEDSKSVIFL